MRDHLQHKRPESEYALPVLIASFRSPTWAHLTHGKTTISSGFYKELIDRAPWTAALENFDHAAYVQPFATSSAAQEAFGTILKDAEAVFLQLRAVAEESKESDFHESSAFISQARRYCFLRCFSRVVELDRETTASINDLRRKHSRWFRRFQPMASSRLNFLSFYGVYLRYFLSSFNLAVSRATKEMEVDRFGADFAYVVELAEILEDISGDSSADTQATVARLRYGTIPVGHAQNSYEEICSDCLGHMLTSQPDFAHYHR